MKREKLFGGFAAGLMAIVILLTGCAATLPPVKPIKDFKDIAGTWKGSYFNNNSGIEFPGTRTIRADGTLTIKGNVGRNVRNDTLKLTKDGKALTSGDGTYTLHEGDGKRILFYSTPRGSGQFTPTK